MLFTWTGASNNYLIKVLKNNDHTQIIGWISDKKYTVKNATLFDSVGIAVGVPGRHNETVRSAGNFCVLLIWKHFECFVIFSIYKKDLVKEF